VLCPLAPFQEIKPYLKCSTALMFSGESMPHYPEANMPAARDAEEIELVTVKHYKALTSVCRNKPRPYNRGFVVMQGICVRIRFSFRR
jgi:hypothetical protein